MVAAATTAALNCGHEAMITGVKMQTQVIKLFLFHQFRPGLVQFVTREWPDFITVALPCARLSQRAKNGDQKPDRKHRRDERPVFEIITEARGSDEQPDAQPSMLELTKSNVSTRQTSPCQTSEGLRPSQRSRVEWPASLVST